MSVLRRRRAIKKDELARRHPRPQLLILPNLGAGMRVMYGTDGVLRRAYWDRPEDAEQAMREAGME